MKLKYASLTVAALFGFLPVVSAPAQEKDDDVAESTEKPDAETIKLAKAVIDASKVRETMEKSVSTMIEQGKKAAGSNANLPPEFWTEVEKEFHKKLPELIDSMVPMYAKHFTKSDLAALAEFYKSPAGKKFAEKQPAILQESMVAGQAWGEKIGRDVAQRLMNKKAAD